jgi:hypothetical protein
MTRLLMTFSEIPKKAFPFAIVVLACSTLAHAQIDPGRRIDWSQAGIPGGIPTRNTVCATLNPGASASQINSAISSCPANQVVMLNAGTYNLSGGIVFNGKSNVTLRGAGANQTFLVMSSSGGCIGQAADICIMTPGNNWFGSPSNSANFTGSGPWPKGTTQIALSSVSNLSVGQIMILDQVDDLTDNGVIYVCEESPSQRSGQNPNCNEDSSGTGGDSGAQRGPTSSIRGQQQIVTVTGISGNTVTFTPGLYSPNWRSSQSPGAWWDSSPVSLDGIENLSIQHGSGGLNIILISNCSQCWVKGIRSMAPNRSHVSIWTSAHVVVRDSYFYQTQNGVSQSYGVETFGASDILAENNIYQQVAAPQMFNSDCEGCVAAYNFGINDFYTASTSWLQQGTNFHSSTMNILLEGNVGSGLYSDRFHGTSHFATIFRNRYDGYEKNGSTNTSSHTNPIIMYPFSRFFNVVGNVLGSTGRPHTVYQNTPGSKPSPDQAIYIIGTGADFVQDDPVTVSTLMRWGNYDVVNNAVQFSASEVPSGIANFPNPVPTSQTLPPSMYLSSKPGWWPASKPWPGIGPDVTGGNIAGVGGHAYTNPAQDCFLNTMGGPADGTGSVLSFNASLCYASSGGGTPPSAPTNLRVVAP